MGKSLAIGPLGVVTQVVCCASHGGTIFIDCDIVKVPHGFWIWFYLQREGNGGKDRKL